ncbi:branched-chain amino acid ABC transporter permease/ATP-binding protein [Williamsia maris]|uniref:ABC-type branched-chain amino acid transport system, ATPase component n=1 Tax=Williamsia maris TaxID=72806 RepID=A0ABT1HBA0_9NOCA|nr:branched-chain amino acid ABC transporter permease/ATP-binding protein [Williamsia maris]MCP2175523.1 ABC-type branched-chain amino acid transport system, ATPase component [Williamsia maris]
MTQDFAFLVLGLGNGAVYAALGLALVMTFKSSGVINFSTGAVALYAAYNFAFLRQGDLLNPIPGLPGTIDLGGPMPIFPALLISVAISALLGVVLYLVVFGPLRAAPALAKAVAAIGVMLVLQALIALRVGSDAPTVGPMFKTDTISIGGNAVPTDRLLLAAVVIGLAVCAGIGLRYSRFGLATEAASESEKGAVVTGLSPNRIAIVNWALSSAVAGVGGVIIAPIVPLNPVAYTLFIVPALAAALVGNFSGIGLTVGAGLAIGMLQSEATNLQVSVSWLPDAGVAEAVPLVLILAFLLLRGRSLPGRGTVIQHDLGKSPRPGRPVLPTIACVVVAVVALFATSRSMRLAVIITMISAVIALSQVVVTGYGGQVSLAQLALAGTGAYSLSRLGDGLGIPFPVAPLLAAAVAMIIGVVIGLPALRVRGLPLMVATLALAVFVEAVWFTNPSLNGGLQGAPIPSPSLFGLDVGIGAGEGYPRIAFGIVCLIFLLACACGVVTLRRSRLGASMLAVRANERSAAASGINVGVTKLAAFAIASFIAGLGGSLLAYQQTVATAGSYGVFIGLGIFAVAYIAGVTSVTGALLAGVLAPGGVVYLLSDRYLSSGDYYSLLSGLLLVFVVVTQPDGLAGLLHRITLHRRHATPHTPLAPAASATIVPVVQAVESGARDVVLSAQNITVRYGAVTAVNDVNFEVYQGEIVGIIGPNGAGKTTLIDALGGFVTASGVVAVDGEAVSGRAPHRRSRAGLGRTFQNIELYEDLSVAENITVGARSARGETDEQVDEVMRLLGIEAFADTDAADLSQGQRQLVSVARVLVGRPRVALLDEPAAGLDSTESGWLGERLRATRSSDVSIVIVDHDMDLVMGICDRIIVLDLGAVIAAGTPAQVRSNPDVIAAYLGTPHLASSETGPPTVLSEPSAAPVGEGAPS